MAYIASDKLLYLLARYCGSLEELNVDNCHKVTDKGIKFLSGMLHWLTFYNILKSWGGVETGVYHSNFVKNGNIKKCKMGTCDKIFETIISLSIW